MKLYKQKFPIVLAVIEDFGINASWSGNAILSAKPKNFYSLWQRYPHTAIYPKHVPKKAAFENEELSLAVLSTGDKVLSDREFLNQKLEKDIYLNTTLKKTMEEVALHNSALHLIGNLSGGNNRYSEIRQLISLLKMAKREKIYRAYIHLVLDDSLGNEEMVRAGHQLIKEIDEVGIGEIASVCGQNFLGDGCENTRDFIKGFQAIAMGAGTAALSPEQAMNLKGLASPAFKNPTSVLFRGNFVCKINDFDSVLFFNHNNKNLTRLISSFLQSGDKEFKKARYLTVISLFNPFSFELDNLQIAFVREFENGLPSILSHHGKKQLYITDESRIASIQNYFLGLASVREDKHRKFLFVPSMKHEESSTFPHLLSNLSQGLARYLKHEKFEFVFLDIPLIANAGSEKSFSKSVAAIKAVDKFLGELEKIVLESEGSLILTSNQGGAEKLTDRTMAENLSSRSYNPFPFIVVTDESPIKAKDNPEQIFNQIICGMIKTKHFDIDIAPTMLDLMGVEKPADMVGSSFLSQLRIN